MDKDKIKVLFDTDSDGYIMGYQQEFYDGKEWQVPFDTTKAIEVAPSDLTNICFGASKVALDGTITTDASKKAAIVAEGSKVTPTYDDEIATLKQNNDSLESALLELSDIVLSGGDISK